MLWENALSLSAEVAIGLAGFASIFAAVLRRNPEIWGSSESLGFSILLSTAGGSLFASLVPFVAFAARLSEPTIWTLVSLGFSLYLAVITVVRVHSARHSGAGLPVWAPVVSTGFVVLLVLNAALWHQFWPYLATIVWQLFGSFFVFVRLIGSIRRTA